MHIITVFISNQQRKFTTEGIRWATDCCHPFCGKYLCALAPAAKCQLAKAPVLLRVCAASSLTMCQHQHNHGNIISTGFLPARWAAR